MYHKTIIIGNLGQDPDMRYTEDGTAVTNFSVAVNEKWNDKDGQAQEKTYWYKVTCWRKLAEVTNEYLKKGRQVMVEGRAEAEAWTDREGNARANIKLTATTVKFLGGRNGSVPESTGPYEPEQNVTEDLPF